MTSKHTLDENRAIFGGSVITNLTKVVGQIGGENGFVGLIAILLILAIFQRNK